MSSNDNSAELMSAYLDAELPADEAEAFERHLAESPEAREELEDLRKMMQLVQALPEVDAPDDFYEKVSRKIRRRAILQPDSLAWSLVSLPFQVLSILVILTAAGLYMMAELDAKPAKIEADPDARGYRIDGQDPQAPPSPPVP
ncbi:MAG: zf-HC2 domain-containing protein [Myxococcota bacterium]